jgi:hypothetical protein
VVLYKIPSFLDFFRKVSINAHFLSDIFIIISKQNKMQEKKLIVVTGADRGLG